MGIVHIEELLQIWSLWIFCEEETERGSDLSGKRMKERITEAFPICFYNLTNAENNTHNTLICRVQLIAVNQLLCLQLRPTIYNFICRTEQRCMRRWSLRFDMVMSKHNSALSFYRMFLKHVLLLPQTNPLWVNSSPAITPELDTNISELLRQRLNPRPRGNIPLVFLWQPAWAFSLPWTHQRFRMEAHCSYWISSSISSRRVTS